MLARIRLSVPDQPGYLGRVASAIGEAGADVHEILVLAADLGRATDDVWVRVSGAEHLDRVVTGLAGMRGIEVEGVRRNVSEVSRLGELELIRAMLDAPDPQLLVDQAVAALDLTWAAVIDGPRVGLEVSAALAAPRVLVSSARGPAIDAPMDVPVRLAARESDDGATSLVVPLPPTSGAVVFVRDEGPTFHHNEVFRLGELGRVLGTVLAQAAAVQTV